MIFLYVSYIRILMQYNIPSMHNAHVIKNQAIIIIINFFLPFPLLVLFFVLCSVNSNIKMGKGCAHRVGRIPISPKWPFVRLSIPA